MLSGAAKIKKEEKDAYLEAQSVKRMKLKQVSG